MLVVQLKDGELHQLVYEFYQSLFVPIQRFDLNAHDDCIFPLIVLVLVDVDE